MRDVETVRAWVGVVLILTAISVTAFPVLYAWFSPWYRSHLGAAVMLQSIAIALIVDYTTIRRFLFPGDSSVVTLTVYLILISLVCLTSLFLTTVLLYLNLKPKKE